VKTNIFVSLNQKLNNVKNVLEIIYLRMVNANHVQPMDFQINMVINVFAKQITLEMIVKQNAIPAKYLRMANAKIAPCQTIKFQIAIGMHVFAEQITLEVIVTKNAPTNKYLLMANAKHVHPIKLQTASKMNVFV